MGFYDGTNSTTAVSLTATGNNVQTAQPYPWNTTHDGFASFVKDGGWWGGDSPVTFGSLSDGASNTAAYSEFIIDGSGTPPKYVVKNMGGDANQPPQFNRQACLQAGVSGSNWSPGVRGSGWANAVYGMGSSYTHAMLPNETACHLMGNGSEWNGDNMQSASSQHPGGVQVLMGDGAVRFVSNNVGYATWLAIGTRNGSDQVGDY